MSIVSMLSPVMVLAQIDVDKESLRPTAEERQKKSEEMRAQREKKIEELQDKRQGEFCSRFAEQAGKIALNLNDRGKKYETRIDERTEKRESKRDEREGKLEEKRGEGDARRSEMYAKLEEKADTDAKKLAVVEFKKDVDAAIEVRRDAFDATIATFRQGVDALLAGRKDGKTEVLAAFKVKVDAAVAQAKTDCDGSKSPEEVRTTFKNSLKDARTELQVVRKENNQIKDGILELVTARKAAVKAAQAKFKTDLEAAKLELKTAFGETEAVKEDKEESKEETSATE